MKDPSQVSTYRRDLPPPVDEHEEWNREMRRLRAKAHADQARQALNEARRKRERESA